MQKIKAKKSSKKVKIKNQAKKLSKKVKQKS